MSTSCDEFKKIGRKLYEKVNCVEELSDMREWMKGIPEKLKEHQLTLDGNDLGNPNQPATNNAAVTVFVARNDYPPEFLNLPYVAAITSELAQNVVVKPFSTGDNDTLSTPPYNVVTTSIVSEGDASQIFAVSGTDIVVADATLLATHDATEYILTLEAKDGSQCCSRSTSTDVTISVNRNLHRLQFTQASYHLRIREDVREGFVVTTVRATDDDTQAPNDLFYFLEQFSSNYLKIYQNGDIATKGNYRTAPDDFSWRIIVRDGVDSFLQSDIAVTVEVIRDLDSLFFIDTPSVATISETSIIGFSINTARTQPSDGVTFSLTGDLDATNYFKIEPSSGRVTVHKLLTSDKNEQLTYTLTIKATRQDLITLQEIETTDLITVIRNPAFPILTSGLCSNSIPETTDQGDLIFTSTAEDGDADTVQYYAVQNADYSYFYVDQLTGRVEARKRFDGSVTQSTFAAETSAYDLVEYYFSNADDDVQRYFEVVKISDTTAEIRVRSPLNSGSSSRLTYVFWVGARNPVDVTCDASVAVTITVNRNLEAPTFPVGQVTSITIPETEPLNSVLFSLQAVDGDRIAPHNIPTYYMAPSGNNQDYSTYIGIDKDSGAIYVKAPIYGDPRGTTPYQFTAYAIDNGTPQLQSTILQITINIWRNNFTPAFQNTDQYKATMDWNQQFSTILNGVISATDSDSTDYRSPVRPKGEKATQAKNG